MSTHFYLRHRKGCTQTGAPLSAMFTSNGNYNEGDQYWRILGIVNQLGIMGIGTIPNEEIHMSMTIKIFLSSSYIETTINN